jgi:hypothetical protein
MVRALAVLPALLLLTEAPAMSRDFISRDAVNAWMDNYRLKPEPAQLPNAVQALSKSLTFKDPESAGFYVGFIAGALKAEPKRADALIKRMITLPVADQWVLVRAVAYSGVSDWRAKLRTLAPLLPDRHEMIEAYLTGRLPTLDAIPVDHTPTFMERLKASFPKTQSKPKVTFSGNPELLDTLWGEYFATGSDVPVRRVIAVLPWSKDRDNVDRLTVGNLAKVTLANNASRYPDLLAMLKRIKATETGDTAKILAEAIVAGETADGPRLRKDALTAIEEIRRKGPGTKREIALWGQIGQGALAVGCIAAAAASLTALGLPCVVGGAVG